MNDRSAQMALIGAGSVGLGMAIVRSAGKAVDFAGWRSEGFDLIVAATSRRVSFPFLPPGFVPVKRSVLKPYGGCLRAEYKNLYISGTSQLRYGFGSVVTPGMDPMARTMLTPHQLERPIGLVMKELGVRLPPTHLIDAHAALRSIQRGKRLLQLLPWKKKKPRRKLAPHHTTPPVLPAKPTTDPRVEVF
jgi:hypothetical protein